LARFASRVAMPMHGVIYAGRKVAVKVELPTSGGRPVCPLCGEAMTLSEAGWRCECLPLLFVPRGFKERKEKEKREKREKKGKPF